MKYDLKNKCSQFAFIQTAKSFSTSLPFVNSEYCKFQVPIHPELQRQNIRYPFQRDFDRQNERNAKWYKNGNVEAREHKFPAIYNAYKTEFLAKFDIG